MVKLQTSREKLHIFCDAFDFGNCSKEIIEQYESFPFIYNEQIITDDFVWGVQEFGLVMDKAFKQEHLYESATKVLAYASAILYKWWKINVRDNEFTQKELDV